MHGPRARRWTFVVLTTFAVVAAMIVLGRLVLYHYPWRAVEFTTLSVVAAAGTAGVSWLLAVRSGPRLAWLMLIGVGWAVVGGAYLFSYRMNVRDNVRPVLDYIDPRVLGAQSTGGPADLETLARHFASRPPVALEELPQLHLGWLDARQLEREAQALMASRYEFMSLPAVSLPHDLDWDEDPYDSHPWRWRLHNMPYVVNLARAYEQSAHLPYLQRAETLILDWIDDNSAYFFRPPTEYAWNDHTTSLRLANWLFFWEIWTRSPLLDAGKMGRILGSMLGHAGRLRDPAFYWERHNHGIDQDRALLAFALLFPELRASEEWRDLALERLAEQIRTTISPNGVHLEHSPGYHLDVMERLQSLERMLRTFDIEERFEPDLEALQMNMARFLGITVQPNGRLAPLGDTGSIELKETSVWRHEAAGPWLEFYATNGESGTLHDTVHAYVDEGYAVIRDFHGDSVPFDQSLYLLFTSAANRELGQRAHKQADDLSFVLSYRGREFLVDAGVYGYERDRNRDYVVSSRSHNVVLINGRGFTGWDSGMDAFETGAAYTLIRGSHRNYPGFEHIRWIVHVSPTRIILIDDVRPDRRDGADHSFEQLFHFGPEIHLAAGHSPTSVVAAGNSAGEASCPRLRLTQLHGAVDIDIARGRREPMLGWHSPGVGRFEPSFAASFSTIGRAALFVTMLDLAECGLEPPAGAELEAEAEVLHDTRLVVTWNDESGGGSLEIDRSTGEYRLNGD